MNGSIMQKVGRIIRENPKMCYRRLERLILRLNPELKRQDDAYIYQLAAARPDCGYACDEECPVEGRPVSVPDVD
jgi:hypothetical protein